MTEKPEQKWNAEDYDRNARFVSELGMVVVELLSPAPGERILDLGCGDGALTAKLAELGCEVVGVDASPEMIEAARARGLDARVMDGNALDFEQEFDAVFSNAALHWMKEPEAVIAGVWRALKPGGCFVGEMGGQGNVTAIVGALGKALAARGAKVPEPWFFPGPEEYRGLLEAAGFRVESIDLFPRPTRLPGDVGGWVKTLATPYLSVVPEADRQALIAEVVEALRPVLVDEKGDWYADYVRLRFRAVKPL
jgi:trans-aconitate methyltransferase